MRRKLLFFITEDYYVVSHRLALARAASDAGFDVVVVTRVRASGDVIRNAGIRVIPFENERSGLNPLRELSTLLRLLAIYRRERPDVVHHVAMKPMLYGTLAARLAGSRPVVINAVAGMGFLFTSGRGLARTLKHAARWSLRWALRQGIALVQNTDDARLLESMGVPSSRIRLISGSGVDLHRFTPVTCPSSIVTIVFPARLLWDKGIGEFVDAARMLQRDGVSARFVVAGAPDPLNPASVSQEQLARWQSEGVVEFRGWIEDMPALLSEAHIVCLPSHREGLPKSLIEAAAAGRAIVTTDAPGCREVVRDGVTGVLVPVNDSARLAEALKLLIQDPELRARLGANARQHAEADFGIDAIVRQTLALYGPVQ